MGLSAKIDAASPDDGDGRGDSRISANRPAEALDSQFPKHVAIIMDGNARWAERRGLTIAEGHQSGYANIQPVITKLRHLGVTEVTLFAFSTENWRRPHDEVTHIMDLASEAVANDMHDFHRNGVKLRHLGSAARIGEEMQNMIEQAVELTSGNSEFTLNLAFDYGGREDILQAARRIIRDAVPLDAVDDDLFSSYLYTSGSADPDLIIRTGGEFRISNFLLWQSAYSEFHSTETLWPDFGDDELKEAFAMYCSRNRRYGERPR